MKTINFKEILKDEDTYIDVCHFRLDITIEILTENVKILLRDVQKMEIAETLGYDVTHGKINDSECGSGRILSESTPDMIEGEEVIYVEFTEEEIRTYLEKIGGQ